MVQRETIKRGITPAEIKKTVSNRKAQKKLFLEGKERKKVFCIFKKIWPNNVSISKSNPLLY